MSRNTEEVCAQYKTRIQDTNIFFGSNIPPKKLRGAITAYAPKANEDEVLALIDNTVFGSATDGALLTSSTIYAHNISDAARSFDHSKIMSVTFVEAILGGCSTSMTWSL